MKTCNACGHVLDDGRLRISAGELTLDRLLGYTLWRGSLVPLSAPQRDLVGMLAAVPGKLVHHHALVMALELCTAPSSMVFNIRRLFRAVDPDFDQIETRAGFGYLWRTE